ncbi:MAG: helix-turn-helix domain-containing protein [Clostridia bacterium]|nr:helix-turn-helix domain-containing protein [Clostridia bacterium]
MESIGKKISALRKGRELSQEELASALLVSRQTVSKWERGQSLPDADNIAAMCAFFGVSADSLLGCDTSAPQQADGQPQSTKPETPSRKRLWLKILIISTVCFFAFMGLICTIVFIFALTLDDDPVLRTIIVPMIVVIAVVIFSIVTGVVIALYKKGRKPRG